MITSQPNRLDPSTIDREELDRVFAAFSQPGHVAFVDNDGNRTEIPEPIYHHLVRIARMMQKGQAIVMLPENEKFTTQAAANYLGMSRQFLVNLLEKGDLPFHKVGSHRRIAFKDLLAYEKERDSKRRKSLDGLFNRIDEEGKYEGSYQGE